MKTLMIVFMFLTTSCSATLINRGSPLSVSDPCKSQYLISGADLALGSAAGVAALAMEDKNIEDKEFKKTMLLITATGFVVSSIMGYGETRECRE